MKRTNISLTEEQYEWVRENAHLNGVSRSEWYRAMINTARAKEDMMNPKKTPETPKEVNIFKKATEEHIADRVQFGNKGLFNPAPKPKKK